MISAILAISLGAALGALSRWGLGLALNGLFPTLPPGTLVANLAGCYVIGLVLALSAQSAVLAPEWRLFVVTGFLGSLTTFSTFSAEVIGLLQAGRPVWAAVGVTAHVLGSLAMTLLGFVTAGLVARATGGD